MRLACQAASLVLEKTCELVRPGASTREIDLAAADFMADLKCKSAFLGYRGFPGYICISLNEEVVHGIGGPRKIQYGDIVKLDVGVVLNGWVGDTATTVPVGAIDEKIQRLLRVTEETLTMAIIEESIVLNGYNVVREFVGHGVGRKLHEEPQVPNFGRPGSGPKLKAGMVLAVEPMVNMGTASVKILEDGWTVVTADRKPSAHFEHTVLVTKDQPEILTWRAEKQSK